MEDSRQQRIEDKLDRVQEKIASIDSTLAAQHESLKIHIRRTNLLEQRLVPIEKHVIMIDGILKFVGFLAILIGAAEGVLKIVHG